MVDGMIPQLRCRTEFSFRQVYGHVAKVADALAALKAPAAGIVDPGTWGHVRWRKALNAHGIKPLFGTELVVAQPDGRKPVAWALAEDTRAFYKFSTAARQKEADIAALFGETRSGVIRFAGAALTDPDTFDYIDLNPSSPLLQRAALRLHKATGKPLVITSDNAYPRREDYAAFMSIVGRERTTPQHLLAIKELREELRCLDDQSFALAVSNTFEVAERCASELPTAPIIHVEGDLRALAEQGKQRRLSLGHLSSWPESYEARLQRELEAIELKQYDSYFLVVTDLISWAKERMLVGPGRGSSAGSLLCYLLGITEVDPIPHGLLFERFIDLTRKDLPDIDIDFSGTKREQCFEYLSNKYGSHNVARIGNVNTLKPRSVLAEVCKRFGIPDKERFDLLNVMIEYSSGDSRYGKGLEDTLNNTDTGRKFMERHPKAAVMGDVENHAWHTGVHAAGVIVCNVPVDEYCTVGADGVAQLDKPDAEALNLLKIDALGLRTLGIIEDSGVVTADELYALKLDDPEVLDIFNQRKYTGIFQFEGQSQRTISAQVHVDSFIAVDHLTALARPGPLGGGATGKYIARKAGTEPVTYTHPALEELLHDTYGVVLYQEQVMRIVRDIGKFSWDETTVIRKAMSGRKGKEFFDRQGEKFIAGAAEDGIDPATAQAIWSEICNFGAWGMNKSVCFDQRVKLAHPNQFLGANPTIEEVYKHYKESPSPWTRQRGAMPVLLSLQQDGVARPAQAVDLTYNGVKDCVELVFSDGRAVRCSKDHKFIINGEWKPCKEAVVGDNFASCKRERHIKDHTFGKGKGWRKGRKGPGMSDKINGKYTAQVAFREKMLWRPCEACGAQDKRMEVHHQDHKHGLERPEDLVWLCSGCHKKVHMDAGDWLPPYSRGWRKDDGATLLRVEELGPQRTYDIHMPDPDHNYLLANGVVTHNSHTCAYAVISYWCAWMKRYHPLEYAAACLRSAKDDDQTMEILREMAAEGVDYTPFDPELSDVNWSVQEGKLVGGFMNLVGFGPSKAVAAVEARRLGRMDDKLRARIAAAEVKFADLYPLSKRYAALYEDPEAHGCRAGSIVYKATELPDSGDVLYLGKIAKKELRDENETVRVARRDGRRVTGQTLFVDFFLRDDTGVPIICRVDRFKFESIGRIAMENLRAEEDVLLIRGKRIPGFNVIKIERMKCLNRPEALDA